MWSQERRKWPVAGRGTPDHERGSRDSGQGMPEERSSREGPAVPGGWCPRGPQRAVRWAPNQFSGPSLWAVGEDLPTPLSWCVLLLCALVCAQD